MFLLIGDIVEDRILTRDAHGERSVTILPVEFAHNPAFFVDKLAGVGFDAPDEVCDGYLSWEFLPAYAHGLDIR